MAIDFSLANSDSPLAAALAGRQRFRANKARDLLQEAAQNPAQRGQLLSQAFALAPNAATAAQGFYQAQAEHAQNVHERRLGRLHSLYGSMLETARRANMKGSAGVGDMEAYYQNVVPELKNLVGELGGDTSKIPLHYDSRMLPFFKAGFDKTMPAASLMNRASSVPAGIRTAQFWMDWLRNGTKAQQHAAKIHFGLARKPSNAAIQYKAVELPNGATQILAFDPNAPVGTRPELVGSFGSNGNWNPNPAYGGMPSGSGRVTFDFPPGTPPEVIAAAKAAAHANGDLGPGRLGPGQSTAEKARTKQAGQMRAKIGLGPALNRVEAAGEARKTAAVQEVKQRPKARAARASVRYVTAKNNKIIETAKMLRDSGGLSWLAGWSGVSPPPPGTDAFQAYTLYKNLIASLTLKALIELKKHGGTLGQVSEKEDALLEASASRIRAGQSIDDMKAAINDLIGGIRQTNQRMKEIVDIQFPLQPSSASRKSRRNAGPSTQSNSMDAATAAKVRSLLRGQ